MKRFPWKLPLAVAAATAAPVIVALTFLRQSPGPIAKDVRDAKRVAQPMGGPGEAIDQSFVAAHGIVEPSQPEMRLTADAPGRIAVVRVAEGDHVQKGAVLAEVENLAIKAQLAGAEASLAAAQAELEKTMHGMRQQDVSAMIQESVAARAKAALAANELQRANELARSGSIAKAEIDEAQHRYDAIQAEYAAASARAVGARSGSRREDVLVAQAHTREAEAHLEQARAALARTVVLAPADGEVLRLKARVGEFHNPASGDPLVILGDTTRLRVRLDVDERDVARIKMGTTAYVTAPAFGHTRFAGKVVEVAHRMGRRNVRVDDPIDRVDVKVLEVLVELDEHPPLIPGLRVEGFVGPT